ncbi:MAG: gliding motility protein GldL [Bacteroidales bacterium]|jgi:gliding motility-associated protein GldL|nr:gliding motility protein GldL [Bacteroidales bacterium]
MGLNEIVKSKGYKNFMAKLYGFGAAVVILGALFKINHFTGANIMLIVGMGVEAIIFVFSAFEPLHEEVDWSIVYPELAHGEAGESRHAGGGAVRQRSSEEERMLSEKLDDLLKAAHIDSNLIGSLSDGLNKLNVTAKSLNASTDIMGVNTNYAEELTKLTESLGRLNSLYMQQLEASSHQMEATAKAQENMNRIAETLAGTLESSAKYKEEISDLSNKVNSLNKIYGGMLSAIRNVGKEA